MPLRPKNQRGGADFTDRMQSIIFQRRAEFDIDPIGLNDLAAHADLALKAIRHRFFAKMQSPGHAIHIAQDQPSRAGLKRAGYRVG